MPDARGPITGAARSASAATEALYQDTILDHYRSPRNKGPLAGATGSAHIANPTCGDEVTVETIVEGGIIREAKFTGQGCSLAQASASMMTGMVHGASVGAARRTRGALEKLLRGEAVNRDALGAMLAFEGVARYPARISCVMMAWRALERTLDHSSTHDA